MKVKIEDFLKIIEKIKNKTIVVEGKNDVKALKSLGLTNIIPINSKSLAEFVPKLNAKEIVILSDFDKQGKKIAARLRYLTEKYRIKSNPKLRREFMKFGKRLGMIKIEEFEKLGRFIVISSILKNKRENTSFHNISNKNEKISNLERWMKTVCFHKEGNNYGKISANINKIYNQSYNKSERCNRETRCSGGYFWSDGRFA